MMTLRVASSAALAMMLATITSAVAQPPAKVDAYGVVRYDYRSQQKPLLDCSPLHACDIVLEPGEVVNAEALGDSVRWKVGDAMSGDPQTHVLTPHVFVKPTAQGLETNLTILTNRRTYYVDLASTMHGFISRIGFYDYDGPPAAVAVATPEPTPTPIPSLPDLTDKTIDDHYTIEGNQPFRPLRAYNDGQDTFLELRDGLHEAPVVEEVGRDGGFELLNYRVKDSIIVIDGVPPKIALILGEGRAQQRVTVTHG
jgi:type IV secretion system protein VirB9